MYSETEVWSKGHLVRFLSVFPPGTGHSGLDVRRVYVRNQGSIKTFNEHVEGYNGMGMDGLSHWTQTYITSGREMWNRNLTEKGFKNLLNSFRNSAQKNGFIKHGIVKRS